MSPFKMQERDLDLFILEELHSNSGFANWLIEKLGLDGFEFESAEHSVSAKAEAKWGETDVLAFFTKGNERIAVLIEDKISASFTDRQAHRYHERAREIVNDRKATDYRTVLVAPKSYLAGVNEEDPWHHQLAIDEIIEWFEQREGSHAKWRLDALTNCAKRAQSNASASDDSVLRFSQELSEFLSKNYPDFWHKPLNKSNTWGLFIHFHPKISYINISWKINQNFVELAAEREHLGKIAQLAAKAGLTPYPTKATDTLRVPVSVAVWGEPLSSQLDVVNEVIAACQRLRSLAIEIAALPSIIQEAAQLPGP